MDYVISVPFFLCLIVQATFSHICSAVLEGTGNMFIGIKRLYTRHVLTLRFIFLQIAVLRLIFYLFRDFQQPASTLVETVKLFQVVLMKIVNNFTLVL